MLIDLLFEIFRDDDDVDIFEFSNDYNNYERPPYESITRHFGMITSLSEQALSIEHRISNE